MSENNFLKMLCSIPLILIALYFIPVLGVCLVLFRYYMYIDRKKYYNTPIILLICGLLLIIPQIVGSSVGIFNIEIPYINTIIEDDIYIKLFNYSKFLITFSIILIIFSFIIKKVFYKTIDKIKDYAIKQQIKHDEISKQNDLIIKERKEQANNMHLVTCPHCGADNLITGKNAICKFCRRQIEYKQK